MQLNHFQFLSFLIQKLYYCSLSHQASILLYLFQQQIYTQFVIDREFSQINFFYFKVNMQVSISSSHTGYNQENTAQSPVNWVSVINFLENQYSKSSLRQKEWLLEKKLLNQEILNLKSELNAVERLNTNLNNRIKLLQYALKKQKLIKQPQHSNNSEKNLEQKRTIKEIEKYLEKNGWTLNQKSKSLQQNPHTQFLAKVLEEVGCSFNKIQQKCRKLSIVSVETQKLSRKDTVQNFQNLINELGKVKISSKIKVNAHLDSVRGLFSTKNTTSSNLLISVSQDCLVKLWSVESHKRQITQNIDPLACFRQHTGQLFTIDGGEATGNNDTVLFTAGTEESIKVWYAASTERLESLKCVGFFLNDQNQNAEQSNQMQNQIIWQVRYKKQKKLLTSASDGKVRLFNSLIKKVQNKFQPSIDLLQEFYDKNYIQTVIQWVGQRGFLSACSNLPRILLWDLERSKIVQKYSYEVDKIKDDKNNPKRQNNFSCLYQTNSIKYINDTKTIYAGCQDKSIRIFAYDQNKMIKKIQNGIDDSINCIEIYKNNYIVGGLQNGLMKVWDRRTYKLLITEQGHKNKYDEGILCLNVTSDGIFSGGADGIINFYTT